MCLCVYPAALGYPLPGRPQWVEANARRTVARTCVCACGSVDLPPRAPANPRTCVCALVCTRVLARLAGLVDSEVVGRVRHVVHVERLRSLGRRLRYAGCGVGDGVAPGAGIPGSEPSRPRLVGCSAGARMKTDRIFKCFSSPQLFIILSRPRLVGCTR